ncbi:MAG: hypothetical protein ACRELB_18705, partial [Polyangiaceae bacterium]
MGWARWLAAGLMGASIACAGGAPGGRLPRRFRLDITTLTGYWRGDDGGIYAVRGIPASADPEGIGTVFWAGLDDSGGLYKGLRFTNVYMGTAKVSRAGTTISGPWMDVGRGATNGSGTLVIVPRGNTIDARAVTGPLAARHWTLMAAPPSPSPIGDVMNRVHKNQYKYHFAGHEAHNEVLGNKDNLTPMRDHTVIMATLGTLPDNASVFTWPASNGYAFADFCTHQADDADLSADVVFDKLALSQNWQFWNTGWS